MNQPKSLQSGTRIDDYEIQETLWTTSAGFTYRARDPDRDRDVLIQEFLPAMLATRHWSGIHAMPLEGLADEFDQGLTRFLREARILAQINDPYVCRVYEYTEANATAYMVLDYEPGETLKDHLAARDSNMDEGELRKLLVPLLKGLRVAHAAELLHRDIHPANIYLRDVGPPVLIGFGSPVLPSRDDSDQYIEQRVAPGYSPVEQYQSDGQLGPWSDLYALGATMYRCLSGAAPVDAAHRIMDIAQDREDPLVPATELGVGDYSSGLLSAIDWMMEPMAADRPDSAGAVLGPLTAERAPPRPTPPADRRAPGGEARPDKRGKKRDSQKTFAARSETYRDHSKRGTAAHRAPPPADPMPTRSVAPVQQSARPGKRVRTGWKWPALLVLGGISAAALFALYRPSPPPNETAGNAAADIEIRTPDPELDETYPPPELPQTVNFGRDEDDRRAEEYRDLEEQAGEIERLLAAARRKEEAGRLMSPAGDNALADYRAILELNPEHTDARLGIAGIQTELVKQAEAAFQEDEDIEAATELLDQAAELREESDRALALRRDIERHLAEQERQERLARKAEELREEAARQAEQARREEIRNLVDQADAAFEAGRLVEPPGDNALAYYRQALRLEPEQPDALQGVERIGKHFRDQASNAIASDELDRAGELLSTADAVLPDDETVALLRKQLDTRRSMVEQQRREEQALAALEEPAVQVPEDPPPSETDSGAADTAEADTAELEKGIAAYYAGDYDIAYRLLNPLAEDGEPRAKFRVAMMYYHGRGVAQNTGLAEALIREALPDIRARVEAGEAWAQADLGTLYADGIVVAENNREAVRLYQLAAEQGYAGAQTNLGVMYANGEGVFRDRDNAILWLQRAAAQGDRIAQKNLQALGVE